MSGAKTLKNISSRKFQIGILSILAIAGFFLMTLKDNSSDTMNTKDKYLNPDQSKFTHTSKLETGVRANFEMLTEEPEANSPIDMKILIERFSVPGEYDYKLSLPDGVSLLHGQASGHLDLRQVDEIEFNISILQTSDQDQKVQLILIEPASGQSTAYVFNTLAFHQKAKEQAELMDRMQAYEEEQRSAQPNKK